MKKVEKMICHIMDEVCGAIDYAEKYLLYQNTHPEWSKLYAKMAQEELDHADNLHTMYQEKIDQINWMPEEAKEEWEKCVRKASEKSAMVKLMLSK